MVNRRTRNLIEKALSIFSIFRSLRGSLKIQIGNIIIVYFELVYAYLVIVTTFISFVYHPVLTAQKMKFPIKNFFSNCDQISFFLEIWLHLLQRLSMENFIFFVHFLSVSHFSTNNAFQSKIIDLLRNGKNK